MWQIFQEIQDGRDETVTSSFEEDAERGDEGEGKGGKMKKPGWFRMWLAGLTCFFMC